MKNEFIKEIIMKNIGSDEKKINSFYNISFSNFLNPFSIKNVNIAVQKLKETIDNKDTVVYILFDDTTSSAISAYLLIKFFQWQKKEILNDINKRISKPKKKCVIAIGEGVSYFSGDYNIRIVEDPKKYNNEIVINGVESSDTNISFLPHSLEVLTFKLIQALFMVTNQIFNQTFVAFDLETTGAGPLDKITEIGAVKYKRGVKTDKFQMLVNPERYIPEIVIQLTGITNEMVKNAPLIDEAVRKFDVFLSDAEFIVVHNGGFDISFMSKYFKKVLNKRFDFKSYDTKMLAQSVRPMSSLSLEHISEDVGVELTNAHRALADAEATGDSFLKLMILDNSGLKIFTERYLSVVLLSLLDTSKDFTGENRLFLMTALNILNKCKVYSIKSLYLKNKYKDRYDLLRDIYRFNKGYAKLSKYEKLDSIEKKIDDYSFNIDQIPDYQLNTESAYKIDINDITRNNVSDLDNIIPLNKKNYKPVLYLENVEIKNVSEKNNEIWGNLIKDNIIKKIKLKNKYTGIMKKIYFTIDIKKKFLLFKTYYLTEV